MPCLLGESHKASLNIDFKEEATRTLIGVFVSRFRTSFWKDLFYGKNM